MKAPGGDLPIPALDRVRDYFCYTPVDGPRSRYLASWRGGSALIVLVGHGFDIFYPDPHPIWGVLATCAVLIFFGLSGFFIHKALAKSVEGGETRSFVIGRVNRILPPFGFSMLLVLILWTAAPTAFYTGDRSFVTPTARAEFSLDGFVPSLLLLNGFIGPTLSANGPLWSLSYEVWYYLAAWLFALALIRKSMVPLVAMTIVLLALTVANPRFALLGTVWFAGFALSALHGRNRIPAVPAAPLLALAALTVLLAALETFRGAELLANIAAGVWFVAHMATVLRGEVPIRLALLERSARFAYAMYVLHFPLLLFIYGVSGERSWLMVPTLALVVAALAAFGYRLEELRLSRVPTAKRRAND